MINVVPDHGHTAGREEEWVVQVHKEPASNDAPMGTTYLTLLSHKDVKISAPHHHVRSSHQRASKRQWRAKPNRI